MCTGISVHSKDIQTPYTQTYIYHGRVFPDRYEILSEFLFHYSWNAMN